MTSTKAAVSIVEGSHVHVGIKESLEVKNAAHQLSTADKIAIQVNTEGISLFKSATSHLWTILGFVKRSGTSRAIRNRSFLR